MLVFIIPLRSAKVAKSWDTVSKLLERTLRSVCRQTVDEFRVIVVCHELPILQQDYPKVEYVSVDLPIPDADDLESKETDKYRKLWVGLQHARKFDSSHIMFVDSDDCVSQNIAAFVKHHANCDGWYVWSGYEYVEGRSSVQFRKQSFEQYCGSCNIVRTDLLQAYVGDTQLSDINDSRFLRHETLPKLLKEQGILLEALPFPGAIYITNNSENSVYQQALMVSRLKGDIKKILRFYALRLYKRFASRRLTEAIRREFGLYDLSQC